MNGWSKFIGGFLGFLLAGPRGCILGILIGYIFDKNLTHTEQYDRFGDKEDATTIHQVFFESTFLVMGHLAKSEGRVSESTIISARAVMENMGLTEEKRRAAIHLFNQGKQPGFSLQATLQRLIETCRYDQSYLKQFLEIQTQVALAETHLLTPAKKQTLEYIYRVLGFSILQFNWFDPFMEKEEPTTAYEEFNYHTRRPYSQSVSTASELSKAYELLGISKQATKPDIKKAYRRLISQYHPDKLASQGLSKIQLEQANQKTHQIKAAYDKICKAKGFS